MKFETQAIHAGQDPDPPTGAVMTPIYQTSTFAQQGVGRHRGYEYARTGNPTRTALEACLAALEGGAPAMAVASGMAWLEPPSNPLLRISDLRAVADLVHRARPGAWLAVDNTFATPYLQRPLELGADLGSHSTTKYLGGPAGA